MRAVAAALLLALAGCATDPLDRHFGPGGRTIREELATWSPELQAGFAKVSTSCTACHTLNPVFAARIPAGGWAAVVGKMAKRPGAAIPEAERPEIAAWLEHYSAKRREAGGR